MQGCLRSAQPMVPRRAGRPRDRWQTNTSSLYDRPGVKQVPECRHGGGTVDLQVAETEFAEVKLIKPIRHVASKAAARNRGFRF